MTHETTPSILFVEDDKETLELLEFIISREYDSYELVARPNAEEALELISERRFDLYILDYSLPEMTGLELCQRIRTKDLKTPIMFFTGMAHIMDRKAAIKAGATEYLVKPNDINKLKATVRRLLKKSNGN